MESIQYIYIILSHLFSFWGKRKKKKVELESWTERRENCAVAIASCETLSFHDSVANLTCSNRVRDAWWIVLSLVWGLRIFRTCFDNRIKLLIYRSLFSRINPSISLFLFETKNTIYIFLTIEINIVCSIFCHKFYYGHVYIIIKLKKILHRFFIIFFESIKEIN